MNWSAIMPSRADTRESVAQGPKPAAILSKVVRRLTIPLTQSLARFAPAAARFAMRWQPEVTFRKTIADRRRAINRRLYAHCSGVVDGGPFQGMKVSPAAAWGDGDLAAKLIGCYEQELHAQIEAVTRGDYKKVIVVGCAEGYYAVGLGRRMPGAHVIAFETAPEGQAVCRENAELNGLSDRLQVLGDCDVPALTRVLTPGERAFLLFDCEGAERQLVDPIAIPALATSDFIVECHDFLDRTITETLIARLSSTHTVVTIHECGRNPNTPLLLQGLSGLDRSLAVCEVRPEPMHWLVASRRV